MPKYQCELHDREGASVLIEVDATEWPMMPDVIIYAGRVYVVNSDHVFREARVFWFSGLPVDPDEVH